MKRRELDRNAVVGVGIARLRTLANARDRMGIAVVITPRILGGARGLAQHVEAREFGLFLVGALDRGVDRLAHHELLAEQLPRRARRLADHRLAPAAAPRFNRNAVGWGKRE